MAQSFNPEGVWAPFGAFSQMVIGGSGPVVYLKGQVALDASGTIVGPDDMRVQMTQVLKNIKTILSSVGGRMSDVISLTQYTTDIAAFMEVGDIRQSYFEPPYPVTTTVEVAALYDASLVVEIAAIAEIPTERFIAPGAALQMHN